MESLTFASSDEIIERYPDCAGRGRMGLVTDVTARPPRAYVVCCGETFAVGVEDLHRLHERGYFGREATSFLLASGVAE